MKGALALALVCLLGVARAQLVVKIGGSTAQADLNTDIARRAQTVASTKFSKVSALPYDGSGSGGGRSGVVSGAYGIGFADTPYSAPQAGVLQMPFAIGTISVFVNPRLVLSTGLNACQLAGIFKGTIKSWSAVGGPNVPIRPAWRSDTSGSSQVLSTFLGTACANQWSVAPSGARPSIVGPAAAGVLGSGAMRAFVAGTPGAIGYIDTFIGIRGNLKEAVLCNPACKFKGATANYAGLDDVIKVIPPATGNWATPALTLAGKPNQFPMGFFAFMLAKQDQTGNAQTGCVIKALVGYWLAPAGGQSRLAAFRYAPTNFGTKQSAIGGYRSMTTISGCLSSAGIPAP